MEKDLAIGTRVRVRALAEWEYHKKERTWHSSHLLNSREGFYVGYTFKQEGTLMGSKLRGFDGDYDPPYLEVSRTIRLCRIKFSARENDRFAFPADVTILKGELDV